MSEPTSPPQRPVIPPLALHATPQGTFRLYEEFHLASLWATIYLDNRFIARASHRWQASSMLANGWFDAEVGFPVAPLRIPLEYEDWNGGKGGPVFSGSD